MAGEQAMSAQALYRACMKEAANQGKSLMERLVERASPAMLKRAAAAKDDIDRRSISDAAHMLVKHQGALCESYPQALLAEFAQAIAGAARKATAISFDSLELMGDAQVQESVELLRLQQSVLGSVEMELADLNTLVCAVQGLKTVQADRNPLRPEAYVRSLRTAVLESPVPTGVRVRWLQGLGDAMGPELARVYRELSKFIRSHGVVGAGFNVISMPDSPRPASGARAPGGAEAAPSQSGASLNVKELRRLLSGEFDAPVDAVTGGAGGPPTEFSATVPAAFEALQEMKQVDQVMRRLRERQAAGGAAGLALHEQLQKQARGPGQALGLEVVNLMVENIASDTRLLPPVQQAVRDLEPALLRLALGDPRFFSDRKHPARRLLEEMTQRSLAWDAVDGPGFAAFIEPLQQAVEILLSTQIEGAEPFAFALQTLEEAWGDQQRRDRRYREKAVRALLQAEQRNLLAERIAREMRLRDDVAAAPREVLHFITGPWSQVMAQARLADESGAADPGGYAGLVNDLVWSAQPRMAGANAARLARLIPELLRELRAGLATIDYPAAATQRFLDYLAAAHLDAVKGEAAEDGELLSFAPSEEDEDPGPWLAPREAQHSGFMDTHQAVEPKAVFQETQAVHGDTQPGDDTTPGVPDSMLQPGTWLEMNVDGNWSRYQVTWASPHATLFMFANAAGKTHSMTRRLLGKMLRGGDLRLISGQAVVDGALDAVAQTALSNSLDLKL